MRSLARSLGVLTLLLLVPASAFAQATLTGTVRDTSGAVLPGVTVEASSPALIEKVRTATTDGSGQFRIVDLRAGTYTLTATLPGFVTVRREGIELTGTQTLTFPLEMRVGGLEETIVVSGGSEIIQTQSAAVTTTLDTNQILKLPTGSRSALEFITSLPGVNTPGVA